MRKIGRTAPAVVVLLAVVASLATGTGEAAGATTPGVGDRPAAAPAAPPAGRPSVPLPVPDGPSGRAGSAAGPDGAVATRGAPVDPSPVALTQPDGTTLTAYRWGDGVSNGYEDASGRTIARGPSGAWVYAEGVDAAGDLVLGSRVAGRDVPPPGVDRGLRPDDPGPLPTPGEGRSDGGPSGAPHVPHAGPAPTLVILTQFTDRASLGTTPAEWRSAYFGATASVGAYFDAASAGALDVVPVAESHGTVDDGVVGWVTVPRTHPNTGTLDAGDYANINATAGAAVVAANPYVDFAAYDTNGNGSIEPRELHVVVIAAGLEASSGSCGSPTVWGHRWTSYHATPPTVDGKVVLSASGGYTMFGEAHCGVGSTHRATIGIMVHELGHDIGWPDLYDTTLATQGGVGRWSVMASGSWNSTSGQANGSTPPLPDPFLRSLQGWVTPTPVAGASQTVTVPAATSAPTAYRVLANPGGVDWAMAGWGDQSGTGEYFLVENRQLTGWDAGLPGCGILIWHVDETRPTSGVNDDPSRRLVQLEQADGFGHIDGNTNRGDGGDPYPGTGGNTLFAVGTTPSSRLYDGADSGVSVQVPAGSCTASKTITISSGGTTPATPPNDAFAAATALGGTNGSAAGSTTGATKEAEEPDHAGDDGGASVWWRWMAPASGRLTVTTAGSGFDTLLAVYVGSSVGSLATVASNDDAPGAGLTSAVRDVPVVAGSTYRIAVDGYDGGGGPATGAVTLGWSLTVVAGPAPFGTWKAFIDRQCLDLFGSLCTPETVTEWSAYLAAAPARWGELVAAIRSTSHHTSFVDPVARLYRAFFLRHPDGPGLRYWITQRTSGSKGLFRIADDFAASREFRDRYGSLSHRGFVELVYDNVLGRRSDQAGIDYWTAELTSGRRTRGSVMVGFSESAEYKQKAAVTVDLAVLTLMMLDRRPTGAETDLWAREAEAGLMDSRRVAEWVLVSTEYAGRA